MELSTDDEDAAEADRASDYDGVDFEQPVESRQSQPADPDEIRPGASVPVDMCCRCIRHVMIFDEKWPTRRPASMGKCTFQVISTHVDCSCCPRNPKGTQGSCRVLCQNQALDQG